MPGGCQALTRRQVPPRIGREGKSLTAVTHLALLGVKKQEAAFWGYRQKKRAVLRDCSFMIADSRRDGKLRNGWRLNRSQRMQMKAFICLLGVILIAALCVGKLFSIFAEPQEEQQPSGPAGTEAPHVPVIQVLKNVWILEEGEDMLSVFRDGQREAYPYGETWVGNASGAPETVQGEAGAGESEAEGGSWMRGSLREQVADVELTDGAVTSVRTKTEKISGRVLGADDNGIEVEGYGMLPLSADCRGYKLYGEMRMCTPKDLYFGYGNADFCLENGEICGILMVREETPEKIRVLIRTGNYGGNYHERLVLTADTDFTVTYGNPAAPLTEGYAAGQEFCVDTGSSCFQGGRVWIVPDVQTGRITLENVERSQGRPAYRGQLELVLTDQGIVVINELPLEEYLYSVVPSEMPSRYPGEALKAQAVCARTYAYDHIAHAGYPRYGAHVDDSTSYQVYNNILEQESTTAAVRETYGQILCAADGTPASVYYYSTSCGVGSDENVWKTAVPQDLPYLKSKPLTRTAMAAQTAAMTAGGELPADDTGDRLREESAFAEFISSVNEDDFENQEGWYRWTYTVDQVDPGCITKALRDRYDVNEELVLTLRDGKYVSEEISDIGSVKDISVAKRGSGGVAEELVIEGKKNTYKVISEHNIRYVLNSGTDRVKRQDGSLVESTVLLPSGFFIITTGKKDGSVVAYTLTGGGFGHGVGMSQNGAAQMAREGFQAQDILLFFFEGCDIRTIYEETYSDAEAIRYHP